MVMQPKEYRGVLYCMQPLEHFLDFSLKPRNIEIPNLRERVQRKLHMKRLTLLWPM